MHRVLATKKFEEVFKKGLGKKPNYNWI